MWWNGTEITGIPTLIYHDELVISTSIVTDPNGPGHLICRSETQEVVDWLDVHDNSVTTETSGNFFQQRMTTTGLALSRLSQNIPFSLPIVRDVRTSGLWACGTSNSLQYVGLYARLLGKLTLSDHDCS